MKLMKRLQCVALKVPQDSKVADIGTDHAYIPVYLIKNGIAKSVIAADVNKGPLERANKHIYENGLVQLIETRRGHGLNVIRPGEADTVIIAGMGGILIRDILADAQEILDTVTTLVLQPMIAQEVLREWLYKNGFKIIDEELAREGNKIYTVIVAEHGSESVDEIYYDIGKKLFEQKDPLLGEYLKKKINKVKKVLYELEGQDTENAVVTRQAYEIKLKKYEKLLENI